MLVCLQILWFTMAAGVAASPSPIAAAAEDFTSLMRVFPRRVLPGGSLSGIDETAALSVQSGARVKAPALEWKFTLRDGRAAVTLARPMPGPPGRVWFWLKNPFGHQIFIALQAVSSTGMVVGWRERDVSSARGWTELVWKPRDATVIEAPAGSEPLPIREWRILVHGPAGKRCRIYLDEFSVEPPQRARITVREISCPQTVPAGRRMHVRVNARSCGLTVFHDLRVELRERGRAVAWAPVAHPLSGGRTSVELAVPMGLPPGSYTLTVTADPAAVTGPAADGVKVQVTPADEASAGRAEAIAGIIWADAGSVLPGAGLTPKTIVWLTCNCAGTLPGPDVVMPDGSTSYRAVDAALNRAVQLRPHVTIIAAIYVGASPEWLAEHPGEAAEFRPGNVPVPLPQGWRAPSLASDKWLTHAADQLAALVAYVEKSPWAGQVAGYLVTGGDGGWCWPGEARLWPDYSPAAARAFRKFLRQRYKSLENLRAAWGQPQRPVLNLLKDAPPGEPRPILSWGEIEVPDPRRRAAHPLSILEPPAFNDVVDFRLFVGHASAAAAAAMARAAASAAAGKPVGVFYDCWLSQGQEAAFRGALGLGELLGSDAVNFVVFRARSADAYAVPVSMVHRAGKRVALFVDGAPTDVAAAAELLAVRHPDALIINSRPREEQIAALAEALKSKPPPAQVAAICDTESAAAIAAGDELFERAFSAQLHAVAGSGAAYEIWSLREIDSPALRRRRALLFLAAYRLDQKQREAVEALKGGGRILVFSFAAGAMRPLRGISGRDMCALTGIAVVPVRSAGRIAVRALPGIAPWTGACEQPLSYGTAGKAAPWFCVIDPAAQALGYIQGKRLVGLAARDFGRWKALYSAAPAIPTAIVVGALRAADVRLPARSPAATHPAD